LHLGGAGLRELLFESGGVRLEAFEPARAVGFEALELLVENGVDFPGNPGLLGLDFFPDVVFNFRFNLTRPGPLLLNLRVGPVVLFLNESAILRVPFGQGGIGIAGRDDPARLRSRPSPTATSRKKICSGA
jgi:hypothetical protein